MIEPGYSRSDYNPYENCLTKGLIESTILRGEFLVKDRKFVGSIKGQFINRT
jgi:dihydroorotase-like cyclic amidohydrolase